MTQSDLFGGEPDQTRLTYVIDLERVTDGVPVTALEVWSAAHTKRGALFGRVEYRGAAHDLLPEDLTYFLAAWHWDTIPNLKRWLKKRARDARKYDREHPWENLPANL